MQQVIGTEFYNWQAHQPADDPRYNRCSPNLQAIADELGKRWGMTNLGCYGERPIRAGTAPSSHSHGASIDRRYLESIGRARALSEVIPWLIDNSAELHVSSIHDYIGARIWHAGRGWKAQSPNRATGMGQSWAGYFHIETTLTGWGDVTPIPNRLLVVDVPPVPIPTPGGPFMHATIKRGDVGPDVFAAQVILRRLASQFAVVCDGQFGTITEQAVSNVQTFTGQTVTGVVDPATWAVLDQLANGGPP